MNLSRILVMLGVAAGAGVAGSVTTSDDQSFLAIFAETKLMRVAGMKAIAMPKLPPGIKLPGNIVLPGAPSRTFDIRLWSPSIAPDSATASVAPPAGLKLGSSLALDLFRPAPANDTAGGGTTSVPSNSSPQDFTIKVYWGSSETVKDGQPKVFKISDLTPEQASEMSRRSSQMSPRSTTSYFYKPNWTTGYWPSQGQKGSVEDGASLVGTYSLDSNYTGKVTMDVPSGVDFLPAINLSSPNLEQKVGFDGSLSLAWDSITGALGSSISIIGMEGQNTLIIWSSSEQYQANLMANSDYLQMSEVRDRVAEHSFLSPDTTHVSVPSGIFQNSDFVMMNMIAYGPGAATDKTQPIARLQTKSTLSVMLGGKKARH